jgi:3-oxo-5-alpha-steroid 4-dehydrogenase 3
MRTVIFLPIFLVASGVQNDCHRYLASLPKYTLPEHPIFVEIVCPHYTAECLIYLSLAFMAAPRGALINKTIFTVLLFCATNLGATADSTKRWYEEKFGTEKVSGRWRMIPKVW